MLGLHSLALFASKTRRKGIDLQVVLAASRNPNYRKNIHIDEHSALIQQHVEVSSDIKKHKDGESFQKLYQVAKHF